MKRKSSLTSKNDLFSSQELLDPQGKEKGPKKGKEIEKPKKDKEKSKKGDDRKEDNEEQKANLTRVIFQLEQASVVSSTQQQTITPKHPRPTPIPPELAPLFSSITFSDILLHAYGAVYPAHRCLLASQSTVFHQTFTEKKEMKEIWLKDDHCPPEFFEIFMKFFYGVDIFSDPKPGQTYYLLILSEKYQVKRLKETILSRISETLSFSRVPPLLLLCDNAPLPALREVVTKFCCENFHQLLTSPDFPTFPLAPLKTLLTRDDLVVPNEATIFSNIARRRPPQEHRELFTLVRLPLIPPHLLYQVERETPLADEHRLMLSDMYRHHCLGLEFPRVSPREYSEVGRYFWPIRIVSKIPKDQHVASPEFRIGEVTFLVSFHPSYKGKGVGLFLHVKVAQFPCEVMWAFQLWKSGGGEPFVSSYENVYERMAGWGSTELFSGLEEMESKGVLVDDTVLVELVVHEYNHKI